MPPHTESTHALYKEDTDESCSRGVDENELEDETQSEEDIEDIFEKVLI